MLENAIVVGEWYCWYSVRERILENAKESFLKNATVECYNVWILESVRERMLENAREWYCWYTVRERMLNDRKMLLLLNLFWEC
jgi:hypothetical protein